jgi:hypothetical protein
VLTQPGDQPANLPRRQFQPFCRTPWLELAVRHVLNDLESVQLAHRHRDPLRCSHRSLRQFEPPPACAETLGLRHFNFAQIRHNEMASPIPATVLR